MTNHTDRFRTFLQDVIKQRDNEFLTEKLKSINYDDIWKKLSNPKIPNFKSKEDKDQTSMNTTIGTSAKTISSSSTVTTSSSSDDEQKAKNNKAYGLLISKQPALRTLVEQLSTSKASLSNSNKFTFPGHLSKNILGSIDFYLSSSLFDSEYPETRLAYAAKRLHGAGIVSATVTSGQRRMFDKVKFIDFVNQWNFVFDILDASTLTTVAQDKEEMSVKTRVNNQGYEFANNESFNLVLTDRGANCVVFLSLTTNFIWAWTYRTGAHFAEYPEFESKLEQVLKQGPVLKPIPNKTANSFVISKRNGNFELIAITSTKSIELAKTFTDELIKTNYPTVENEKLVKFAKRDAAKLPGKLLLLCGKPGTGKTNYIRNLIYNNISPTTNVVFINPTNVSSFGSPEFMNFALHYLKNSLIVIEEAEKVIVSREDTNSNQKLESPISDLLNITDGILGDALNIKVIATFNTNSVNVDKALKRDGRLFHMQEFDLLTWEQTKAFFAASNIPELTKPNNEDFLKSLVSTQSKKDGANINEDLSCPGTFICSLADLYAIKNSFVVDTDDNENDYDDDNDDNEEDEEY